jgi:hypothetical protein
MIEAMLFALAFGAVWVFSRERKPCTWHDWQRNPSGDLRCAKCKRGVE